jgi:hypothetical protein
MNFQTSKTYVVLAVIGVIGGFVAVAGVMRPNHGWTVSALANADSDTARTTASPTLPTRMPPVERQVADGRTACRRDAVRLCGNVERGEGRIVRCLMEHSEELSPACRGAVAERRMNRARRHMTMEDSRSADAPARMRGPRRGDGDHRFARQMRPSAHMRAFPDSAPPSDE